jgi:YfiH family protein
MRTPEPFHPYGDHIAIELRGAQVLFTTRRGGHSEGPYASLNLGRLTDDDPGAVDRNRLTLEREIGVGLAFVHQVHGSRVLTVGEADAEASRRAERGGLVRADGQVTDERGIGVTTLAADCLPVAVAGPSAVAMLHAGWRGLHTGVIGKGVAALRELGERGELSAAVGPGAGPCCYEVGPEVHEAFAAQPSAVHHGRRLDLKSIAAAELKAAGVTEVHDLGICTICADPDLLFSHRRDRGVTGRQAGVAWLT